MLVTNMQVDDETKPGDEESNLNPDERKPESRLEYRGLAEYIGFSDKQKYVVSCSITAGIPVLLVCLGVFLLSFFVTSLSSCSEFKPATKRLYEDSRLAEISLSATSTEITEGGMVTLTLALSEMLEADATFNLVGVSGAAGATYGTFNDWNLSVGGNDCASATEDSPCEVMIPQGETTAQVIVAVNTDTDNESSSETFTVSVEVDSGSASILQEGSRASLTFTIPADPPLPTVSLNYGGSTTIAATSSTRMRIDLSKTFHQNEVKVTLVGGGATYANAGTGTWNLQHIAVPAGMMPENIFPLTSSASCLADDITGTGCEITFQRGQSIIDVNITAEVLTIRDTINLTLGVHSESSSLVALGSPSTLTLTASKL